MESLRPLFPLEHKNLIFINMAMVVVMIFTSLVGAKS